MNDTHRAAAGDSVRSGRRVRAAEAGDAEGGRAAARAGVVRRRVAELGCARRERKGRDRDKNEAARHERARACHGEQPRVRGCRLYALKIAAIGRLPDSFLTIGQPAVNTITRVRIVLGSDERTELTDAVVADLEARGATVTLIGPPAGDDLQWPDVGRAVGECVARGDVDSGVLFCWTGTGASIAANKVRGVRAALCTDAETAKGARRWNDANVLVMSLRLTSPQVAREMLDMWFDTPADPNEVANIESLEAPDTQG
jgi:ribose 5-phosphate isomerase B